MHDGRGVSIRLKGAGHEVLVGRDVDAVLRVLAVSSLLRCAALLTGCVGRVRFAGAGGDDDVGPDVVVARRDVAVVTPEF